jgi:anti-sigma regulatory factor (Ser/Thr protein kinase)
MQSPFSIHLPCDVEISSRARTEVARRLNGSAAQWTSDVELLVSELVTNGFEHGQPDEHGRIELRVDPAPERLRVEVIDCGAGFAFDVRRPEPDADASFGLFLVESMSDRWGVDVAEGRTRVWFEVATIAAG